MFRILTSFLTLFLGSLVTQHPEAQVPQPNPNVQYKKQNRDVITDIAKGDLKEAFDYCEKYLTKYPEDLEALFIKAIAQSAANKPADAMISVNRAIELGLPFDRFLAGPRNLLQSLYDHPAFQQLASTDESRIIHGPTLGAVTDSSASLWIRASSEGIVQARASDGKRFFTSTVGRADSQSDFTAVVKFYGLEANTSYAYEILVNDSPQQETFEQSFSTHPKEGNATRFDIGFGGGAGFTPWYESMWNTIQRHNLQAFLLMGDNVYIDTPKVPETQRYCYYRRQSRPEFRSFASNTPLYAIWDDHDFGDNDCTSSLSLDSPPWKRDVLSVFTQNWVNPSFGSLEVPGCWFQFKIGDVDFFMLDCRFYRQNPKTIDQPSMLGPDQLKWLLNAINQSRATFKVIVSSVPWAPGVKPGSKDTWDGFNEERETIFSFIEDKQIDGAILISADRHRSDARRIPRPSSYSFYEFMSSKLTNVHTHKLMENAKGSDFIFGYNEKCSFGKLSFDTTQKDPSITYDIISIDDELIHRTTIKKSQLRLR